MASLKPLPLHLSSQVAPELCDRILDHLHLSKEALSTCSIVCKSWFPTCRYHLFAKVTFSQGFIEFLQSSSHAANTVGPYLRHAVIDGVWSEAGKVSEGSAATLLQHLVCSRFENCNWKPLVPPSPNAILMDSGKSIPFNNLKILGLYSIRFPSFVSLSEAVVAIPQLDELHLDGVSWDTPTASSVSDATSPEALSQFRKPVGLRKLHVASCFVSIILNWLWHGQDSNIITGEDVGVESAALPPSLGTLILPDITPSEAHAIGPFLHILGSSLEHLELGFVLEFDDEKFRDILESLGLNSNSQLKSISIHQITLYQFPFLSTPQPAALNFGLYENLSPMTTQRHPTYTWLLKILSTIRSSSFSHLTFNVWFSAEPQLELIDWMQLNRILVNPSFARLQEVRFLISGIGGDLELVREWIQARMVAIPLTRSLLVELRG